MSATMSSLPVAAAAAAPPAMNGASESSAPAFVAEAADAQSDGKAAGGFGALFQQLLGKQAQAGTDAAALVLAVESPQEGGSAVATEDLNALLPFLEAMGLAKADPSHQTGADETAVDAESATDPALTALAVVTPEIAAAPAISAAKAEGSSAGQSAPLTDFAGSHEAISTTTALQAAINNNKGQAKEASAGGEFAKQLVAAIEGSKEQTPGDVAHAVQQVIANASPRNPSNAAPSLPVAPAVGTAGWSEEVGNRVLWMANRNESRAELVLNPPQMGRVEVSLAVTGDHATANFVSANPAVREALEAALPRLREVLAEAGIQLGQSQVGADHAQQSAQQEKNPDNFGFGRNAQAEGSGVKATSGPAPAIVGLKMGRGLVDVFA